MSDMTMISVESSNLARVGYSPEAREMVIEYRGGARYRYADVPPEVYAGLLEAPSKGSFVHSAIKPRYQVAKLPVGPVSLSPDTEEEQAALAEEREGISDTLAEMGDESQDYYSLADEPR